MTYVVTSSNTHLGHQQRGDHHRRRTARGRGPTRSRAPTPTPSATPAPGPTRSRSPRGPSRARDPTEGKCTGRTGATSTTNCRRLARTVHRPTPSHPPTTICTSRAMDGSPRTAAPGAGDLHHLGQLQRLLRRQRQLELHPDGLEVVGVIKAARVVAKSALWLCLK